MNLILSLFFISLLLLLFMPYSQTLIKFCMVLLPFSFSPYIKFMPSLNSITLFFTPAKAIAFAGVKNKVIEFNEGINLIYGENEKGKSTIQNFIRVWLYGMNNKRSKDIKNNDRIRFMPVDGDTIRGELYVTHNERTYIIIRSFGKTKKQDSSQIIDAETGEEIPDIPKNDPGKYFLNVN